MYVAYNFFMKEILNDCQKIFVLDHIYHGTFFFFFPLMGNT